MSEHDGALRDAIQAARAQHRAGAGAVLDILLRGAGAAAPQMLARVQERGGIAVLQASAQLAPDFRAWDAASARQARCVVLRNGAGDAWLAAEDPWDEALLQRVARRVGQQLTPAAVGRAAIQSWLGETPSANSAGAAVASEQADGPIVQFVDQALSAGFTGGASDVHFECDRTGVTVKHRLDGVMAHFARLDGVSAAQEVISRIKVLAQLDITERRLPQDGRFRLRVGEAEIDLRVSIMPSVHGEDAVLRLLDKAQLRSSQDNAVTLDLLGFAPRDAALIRELAGAPSGMLLVTGPTGSGKTTTVYAALSEVNNGLEKIITIEDPVEYELAGVLQIPVNERKGLTFAKGLRSILRHDPDRILVGEIRDAETAEIAVQSALTGHLVFTTVHANSVADIIGRFRHFDLDMFGFMSSLNGVVVQRLVRRVCPHCAGSREASAAERQWLQRMAQPGLAAVPVPVGCAQCHGAGYKGRFVVAEVHVVDDVLRDHVTEGSALSTIKTHALQRGVEPLLVQAARHVAEGRTTLEEIKRVVGWL
ncbi:MAG TPA: GspE/PulE family protein [Albitalea sp.]|uniref:GspE/PulE family protein n=1 Tax=Piscinibacter sp. TaxID=1903157 RepID=UPI002ED35831